MHCTCDVLLSVVLFCVILFFGYFLFSLFLFLHGLHPLGRVYHSFSYSFFFMTKIERNFTLYMLKKKRKKRKERKQKRKRTSITKGGKLWYSIVYLFLFLSNTLNL